ncbi:MAG TPA: ankyrin repeat domain-containing protein [Chthonomonadaceae bacterium]|nr:ankyrin repeat domain-containing protein [Chthonomonadaceae bacterium]
MPVAKPQSRRNKPCILTIACAVALALAYHLATRKDAFDAALGDAVTFNQTARVHELLENGANANGVVRLRRRTGLLDTVADWLSGDTRRLGQRQPGRRTRPQSPGNTGVARRDGVPGTRTSGFYQLLSQGRSVLTEACDVGNAAIVRDLVAHGANVNYRSEPGGAVIFHCTSPRREQCLDAILTAGADPNARNAAGETPLHQACRSGAVECARELLDHGADIAATDNSGETPLSLASRHRVASTTLLLLERGADPSQLRTGGGDPALVWAAARGSVPLVRRLHEFVLPPAQYRAQAGDALCEAALSGAAPVVGYLLRHGAPVNAVRTASLRDAFIAYRPSNGGPMPGWPRNGGAAPIGGASPARSAALAGSVRPARAAGRVPAGTGLIPPTTTAPRAFTPLMAAAANGDAEMCHLLLQHGARVNMPAALGTPLLAAIDPAAIGMNARAPRTNEVPKDDLDASQSPRMAAIRVLIEHGADVNAGPAPAAPLALAAQWAAPTELLLSHGARLETRDAFGRTPLIIACENGWPSAGRLIAAGSDVNARDAAGRTPLIAAVGDPNTRAAVACARMLLAHGARTDALDRAGRSALTIARARLEALAPPGAGASPHEVVELLQAAGAR